VNAKTNWDFEWARLNRTVRELRVYRFAWTTVLCVIPDLFLRNAMKPAKGSPGGFTRFLIHGLHGMWATPRMSLARVK
jgi:hypothetical protein